ncbi:MAG: tRNA (adenosine(37)-N6)-dimethylallyltransferase MiaA [Candidatus Cryptobacteroides sp.]
MPRKLVILLGPTGVGKTDYSIELAQKYDSPIISCDSRQMYKEMSIGTAVPSADQLAAVKHYFIQTISVTDFYTAGRYEIDALNVIEELFEKGHETLVMTGGSMFYIDAVCKGLDDLPDGDPVIRAELLKRLEEEGAEVLAEELRSMDPLSCEQIDLANGRRVVRALEVCIATGKPFSSFKTGEVKKRNFEIEKIGLRRDRDDLRDRIFRRVTGMMDAGLVDEVSSLEKYRETTALKTVGYRELFDYFDGITSLEEAVDNIRSHTWNYARRQMTWWKRDAQINWVDL